MRLTKVLISVGQLEVKVTSTVHLGRKVGAILLRDVWTDTAEVLLHMVSSRRQLLSGLCIKNKGTDHYLTSGFMSYKLSASDFDMVPLSRVFGE